MNISKILLNQLVCSPFAVYDMLFFSVGQKSKSIELQFHQFQIHPLYGKFISSLVQIQAIEIVKAISETIILFIFFISVIVLNS